MKKTGRKVHLVRAVFCLAGITCLAQGVLAHHSFSMFDRNTEMVIEGTVAQWAFNNPHAWLYVDTVDENGATVQWSFEGAAPPSLIRRGVTGRTFKAGDRILVMFCPLTDGRPGGAMAWARLADGSYVLPNDGGCRSGQQSISKWEGLLEQGITRTTEASGL